jgi:hypothetical protein
LRPDNRLIAAQLEKAWETALQRVEHCRQRLDRMQMSDADDVRPDFAGLADDLWAAWKTRTTMRTRQRLVRALITEINVDIDEVPPGRSCSSSTGRAAGIPIYAFVSHEPGEHGCSTPEQALAIMRSMAGRWSDQDIAAALNRMGMRTGQGKTWTAHPHRLGLPRTRHSMATDLPSG